MYRILAFAFMVLAVAVGNIRAEPARAQAGLPVIATFSILGDITQQVGGDRIDLRTLVGPNEDSHTFEATPADARATAGAAVIFEIGLDFEAWLPDLYRSSRSGARRVAVTDGMSLLRSGDEGHRHGEWDPHVWHDVSKAMQIVDAVRVGLSTADPANAEYYAGNAAAYIAQLEELDAWIVDYVAGYTAPERRKLVTMHNSFSYFGARYGFTMLATALGSTSTEAEPSARQFAAVVEQIRDHGVPAIFPENVVDQRLMQRIADEAGVRLAPPLYSDALGPPGGSAESYYAMIVANVTTIIQALS